MKHPTILAIPVLAALSSAFVACASTTTSSASARPAQGAVAVAPATSTQQPARMAPRMDLHCTPASADDEARCVAQGADFHYGPNSFDNGPARSEAQLARDTAAWQSMWDHATLPCECVSNSPVPWQSPAH